MRRRLRHVAVPVFARPPRRLQRPKAGMTAATLTAELDAWAAGLAEHEHPPAVLERLRLFAADGLVPTDWAALEAADTERRREHLERAAAGGARLVGPEETP